MRIGFIGAGKVGFSLGKYFAENGADVAGYYSRSSSSAREAAVFTGTVAYGSAAELAADCGVVFVTVPDGVIRSVYEDIRKCDISGKYICHCSGAMTAEEAFPGAESLGAFTYSIHPLFPVSSRLESYKELGSAFFCLEGSPEHIGEWEAFFASLGNPVRIISGSTKSKYHAACAISSNLVCALAAESISLLGECGFTEEEAICALRPLALSNIKRVFEVGPAEALTGPIERCDVSTVQKHLKCFDSAAGREMYMSVSRRLLDTARRKHPETDYSEMERLLSE
jgi:predicted short-subunit dehydrogenase-like oxidoreductase (DUF2520 family)